jgi:hypothetical protein
MSITVKLSLLFLLIIANPLICNINIIIPANSQFLPVPPLQNKDMEDKENLIQKSRQLPTPVQPPEIEILTKDLIEGKNVVRINVSSKATINNCKITFTKDHTRRTVDCVEDNGSIYKALIDAKPPYQILEIRARDIYGDSSITIEKLSVIPQVPVLTQIWDLLQDFFSDLSSIL